MGCYATKLQDKRPIGAKLDDVTREMTSCLEDTAKLYTKMASFEQKLDDVTREMTSCLEDTAKLYETSATNALRIAVLENDVKK